MKTNDVLNEGPHDPHIFKAIFLAGGPGSGKSYVANKLFAGTGLRVINSDIIFEYVMKQRKMALDPETIFSKDGQATREYAKGISIRNEKNHIDGRLGLILDGTGKDISKYQRTKKMLNDLGYDTIMVFVNTSLEVAQSRNKARERQIDPAIVEQMWKGVQENLMQFQQLFGAGNFYIIDNTNGVENTDFVKTRKQIDRFIESPPRNRNAIVWLNSKTNKVNEAETPLPETRQLTQSDINRLEFYADKLFKTIGIDINFTRHFLDRVNDERNQRQITLPELGLLFRDEFRRWGKRIASMGADAQAVMKDMRSDVNVPFALNWDRNAGELDLVAKTVMRKRVFTTPDPILAVEAKQKPAPAAQVKGHEAVKKSNANKHPFVGRLVGEAALGSITVAEDAIKTIPITKDYMNYFWGETPDAHVTSLGKLGSLIIATDDLNAKSGAPRKEILVLVKGTIQGKIRLRKSKGKPKEPWQIEGSALSPMLQGKGLMPKIYAFIVNHGIFLQSDYQQSTGGAQIWAKLADDPTVTVYAARKLGGKWEYTNVEVQDRRIAGDFNIYRNEETEELGEINHELAGLGNLVFNLIKKLKSLTEPKFRAQYEEDLKGLNDRILQLNAEKEEVKKRGKDADRAYIYLLAVPAKEAVTESTTGKMNDTTRRATRGLHTYKDNDGHNDYAQYRLGLAVAMADGKHPIKLDKASWAGKKKTTHPYSKEEAEMLKQAYAAIGASYEDLNGDDMESQEGKNVNQVSPVAKPKRNRYGV